MYIHKWFWRGHISSCGHPISSNNGEIHDAGLGLFVPSFQTHPRWKIFRINVSRPNVVLSTLPATKICKSQAEQKHQELLCLAIMPSTTSRYIVSYFLSSVLIKFLWFVHYFPVIFEYFPTCSIIFYSFPTIAPIFSLPPRPVDRCTACSSCCSGPNDPSVTASQPLPSAISRKVTATSSTLLWTWDPSTVEPVELGRFHRGFLKRRCS